MIIDYQLEPKQSPIFIASFILKSIKDAKKFDEIFNKCLKEGFYYSNIILAFDFLFLINKISEINSEGYFL